MPLYEFTHPSGRVEFGEEMTHDEAARRNESAERNEVWENALRKKLGMPPRVYPKYLPSLLTETAT